MNFALSEEQKQLQESLERMVRELCPPRRLHAVFDEACGFDEALWRALLEFGAGGLVVPAKHGGSGLELIDAALAAETLGYHGAPVPLWGHLLATLALTMGANEDLKKKWLPQLAEGSILGSVALGEANARWQPEQWQLAVDDGRITGQKPFVPTGGEAQLLVVGLMGGRLGLVTPDAGGVTRTELDVVDRTRRMANVDFDHSSVLPLAEDPSVAGRLRDAALILLAADAFGGAKRAVDMAVGYAGEREQFGVKIGQFQALKHQLANMILEVEPCRALYWYAAHAFDRRPNEAPAAAALAKAHIAERFMQVARDAVEAHGGIGFTWEYDIQIWLKKAMLDWAWGGEPSIHRERYASLMGW